MEITRLGRWRVNSYARQRVGGQLALGSRKALEGRRGQRLIVTASITLDVPSEQRVE